MKQRKPLRRSPWKANTTLAVKPAEQLEAERQERMRSLVTSTARPLARGSYEGSTAGAADKTQPYRDRALLDMARGRCCLLMVPGQCSHRVDTTVAAHSNLLIHGKAKARKADDCYSVWACAACHFWLDQGAAPAQAKEDCFMAAHLRQVLAWRQIAADPSEPERFRRAARRALDRLNATAQPEVE